MRPSCTVVQSSAHFRHNALRSEVPHRTAEPIYPVSIVRWIDLSARNPRSCSKGRANFLNFYSRSFNKSRATGRLPQNLALYMT